MPVFCSSRSWSHLIHELLWLLCCRNGRILPRCFIGVILTATSVSITVQALKELGKLKTEVGTTILNAAIIDDVIGIIVLTVVIGFKDPTSNPLKVAASTILFFALAIVLGFLCFKLFNRMNSVFPHTRRLPILGLALCFGLSYISEKYFGIADITGAYVAGVILCSLDSSDYIEEKWISAPI